MKAGQDEQVQRAVDRHFGQHAAFGSCPGAQKRANTVLGAIGGKQVLFGANLSQVEIVGQLNVRRILPVGLNERPIFHHKTGDVVIAGAL
jgi:hypothetical protein